MPGCTSSDRWDVFFKAFWGALTKLDHAATTDEDVVAVGRVLSELQLLLSVAVVENGFGKSFKALFEEVRQKQTYKRLCSGVLLSFASCSVLRLAQLCFLLRLAFISR